MAAMLAISLEARFGELMATLERRLVAARSPPPVNEELQIRRHLANVLANASLAPTRIA